RAPLGSHQSRVVRSFALETRLRQRILDLQCRAATHLSWGRIRAVPRDHLDGPRDVLRRHIGLSISCDGARRPSIGAHAALRVCELAGAVLHRAHDHARARRVQSPCARNDHGTHSAGEERTMSTLLTRRALVTAGVATAASVSAVGAASYLAAPYSLIPPD